MPERFQRITPFLWFDDQAEEAVDHYVSIFENSRVLLTARYSEDNAPMSGRRPGSVMTIAFELDGQAFTALNGGPHFRINEAVSLVVSFRTADEVEYFWERLSERGNPAAQRCGWLKDRFDVSWQVVPVQLVDWLSGSDPERARRATAATLSMKKLDLEALRRAVG